MAAGDIFLTLIFDEAEVEPFGPEHPSVGPYSRQLYAAVEPFPERDAANGWAVLRLCHAVGRWFDPVEELIADSDDGPGWSALLDVDRCPDFALPFLAQLAGVRLTQGAPAGVWRQEIVEHENFNRGTTAAIVTRAKRQLTGARRVTVVERWDNPDDPRNDPPYQLLVVTYEAETPDPAAVLADLIGTAPDWLGVKPAGIRLTHRVDPGWSYDQLREAYAGRTYADLGADFASYNALRSNLPS